MLTVGRTDRPSFRGIDTQQRKTEGKNERAKELKNERRKEMKEKKGKKEKAENK